MQFDTAGQRLGDSGQHFDTGGAREYEAAWTAVVVDAGFDSRKERRCVLYFIDNRVARKPCDKPPRVTGRRGKRCLIIKRVVVGMVTVLFEASHQGTLARLPSSGNEYRRRITEGLEDHGGDIPREHERKIHPGG